MPLNYRKKGYFAEGSVEVTPPSRPGEGGVRRLAVHKESLVTQPTPGIDTIPDVIAYSAREHGNRKAMGWREVIDVHEEVKEVKKWVGDREVVDKKTWKYFELSDYKYINYIELQSAISEAARGLVSLGVQKGAVVDIFAETSPNWQIMSHACARISATTATAYDTLGESGLIHSLREPSCVAIFTNSSLLPMLLKVLPHTPTVNFVFFDGAPSSSLLSQLHSIRPDNHIRTMHIDELRALGRVMDESTLDDRKPTPDTLACIMYTSGSTGAPKGVCLTHGNLIAAVGAVQTVFGPHLPAGYRFIAYLPLAHVLEYVVELCAIFVGITCGYARPKTLTDASVRNCKGDLSAFKPNILFGVPAVYEGIRKAVVGKVASAGYVARAAFNIGLTAKKYIGPWVPGVNWFFDRTIFKAVQDAVGGEIEWAVNGGAAVSKDTLEFFNLAVMPLMQGYGLTESCGMCAFLPPELLSFGPVGIPAPSIEIKLVDCPDLGYFSDTTKAPSSAGGNAASLATSHKHQQGEVWIRGPSVTKGYFNRPDLNNDKTIFPGDGWFRTGDIGQWNDDGTLSLIDRLKNLVKMQGGEYIALERLESVYKSCSLVANLCVHASPDMSQPIAIILPHIQNLQQALASQPSSSTSSNEMSAAQMCSDPRAAKLILAECNALAKKNVFARMEMLADVILTADEWTPANGLVTAAQKVNRKAVADTFAKEIDGLVKKQRG